MLNFIPTAYDFANPTPELIFWLKDNIESSTNSDLINLYQGLLEKAEQKMGVIIRNVDNPQQHSSPQGFRGMLDSLFPEPLEKEPQQPVRTAMSGFQRQLEASEFGGSQNISDHIHHKPKPNERVANMPTGFSNQLGRVFKSSECPRSSFTQEALLRDGIKKMETRILDGISKIRMLPSSDPYISSKPAKSMFDEMYKPRIQSGRTEIADGETRYTMSNFEIINITRRGDKLITSLYRPEKEKHAMGRVLVHGEQLPMMRGFLRKAVLTG